MLCSVALASTEFHAIIRWPGGYECVHLPYAALGTLRVPKRRAVVEAVLRSPRDARRALVASIGGNAATADDDNSALPAARDVFMCLVRAHSIDLREVRELPIDAVAELVAYEQSLRRTQYKFGVLLDT